MSDQIENAQHTVAEVHQPDPGHVEESNPLLIIDPGMVIWTWLVFFVVLFLLRNKAWKPILKSLEEREASIKKAFADAAVAQQAIESASEEQRNLIDSGRQKAAGELGAARSAAVKSAEKSMQKAKDEAHKVIADAKLQIAQQRETVLSELKAQMEDLSVMVASRLLDEDLDNDSNRKRIKAYVNDLGG